MYGRNNYVGNGLEVPFRKLRKSERKIHWHEKWCMRELEGICYIVRPGRHPGRQQLLRIEVVEKGN